MEEQQKQIITTASKLFKQYGIKSVSVDDICREMGISKKTFYVYFPCKEEVVAGVLQSMNDDVKCNTAKYMLGKSAIECMLIIMTLHNKVSDVHKVPPFLYDLKKYYPKLYKKHIRNVHEETKGVLRKHLQQGVDEGVYRSDLDVETCAIMFSLIQQSIIRNEDEIQDVSPKRLVRFTLESFVRSIISEEGSRQIKKKIS